MSLEVGAIVFWKAFASSLRSNKHPQQSGKARHGLIANILGSCLEDGLCYCSSDLPPQRSPRLCHCRGGQGMGVGVGLEPRVGRRGTVRSWAGKAEG